MVRLRTTFAGSALAAALVLAPHARSQSYVPGTASTPATSGDVMQSAVPGPTSAPATSGNVMHWNADPKNGLRPATPAGQPITSGTVPQPGASAQPVAPGAPTTATSTAAPRAMPATPAPAAGSTSPASTRKRSRKSAAAEPPPPPPPPPTPEQLPPNPPQVRFQNGELSIDAHNATLLQVLRAVQAQTGASVDLPSSAGSERVVAQIGPGQPQEVLRALLNGSRFDYVILGVAGSPGAVQKVILTPRQAGGAALAAQNNPSPQPQQPEPDEGAAENEAEYQNNNPNPALPAPPPPGGFHRPMIMPGQGPVQESQNGDDQQQGPNGGKTPEQLMQELQQLQQQQQQYQEQLNPANRAPQQQ